MSLSVASLFSGIEGFGVGMERAGMKVAWQVEAEFDGKGKPLRRQANAELLARHFPGVPNYGDVRSVRGADVARVDVLCGGFPCQDISVAGHRAGLAGARSGLFSELMRVVAEVTPRWVVIENVPGLLSSNAGRDMGTVLGVLADLGYGWCYRVFDAQYFGLAQRRERVFIVGCLGDGASAAQVLLEPESVRRASPPSREAPQDVAATLGSQPAGSGWRGDTDRMTLPVLASTLSTANGTSANDGGRRREDDTNIVVYAMRSDAMREGTAKTPSADADGYVRLRDPGMGIDENIAPTLKAGTAHAVAVSSQPAAASRARATRAVRQGMAVRRLTPLECERLQGFADDWTVGFSDAIRYRMLGNAVPVPVSAWIGRRLVAVDARRAA